MGVDKQKKNPFDTLLDLMAILAGLLLLAITLLITYSVILRYLMIPPPIWILQYTEYGLLWITFLGAAWLLRLHGHIRIDTILGFFPGKVQSILEIFNDVLGCAVALIISYFGTVFTIDLFERGIMDVKATSTPKFLIFLIIPLGGATLCLQFIRNAWRKVQKKENK
ncbi:MAG: TRAP transporter small permease [Desulfobacteraceae bacterium]|nr:TRAP transporter small permease [Desulfobacteraceae bacterium]